MQIRSVGIDLGKTTFHLVALSAAGKVLLRKKFTQKQLIAFTAKLQTSLVGMEACWGAHFLGRALREQGHDVKLIPAQFVKPFVKSNKNDFLDAEAIAEAMQTSTGTLSDIGSAMTGLQNILSMAQSLAPAGTSVVLNSASTLFQNIENQLTALAGEAGQSMATAGTELAQLAQLITGISALFP
jgi:transposase